MSGTGTTKPTDEADPLAEVAADLGLPLQGQEQEQVQAGFEVDQVEAPRGGIHLVQRQHLLLRRPPRLLGLRRLVRDPPRVDRVQHPKHDVEFSEVFAIR
jgi:hypothetical protein